MARDLTKSPFPGMDPYLEQYWGDVHAAFCMYSRDQLRKKLPEGLVARLEERTIVQDNIHSDRGVIPDVRVAEFREKQGSTAVAPNTHDEPIILENLTEPITEGLVQILDTRDGMRIVTVVEFMSPANKVSTEGRQMYILKQDEMLYGGVNLVEVDLIRSGPRNLRAPLGMLEREQRAPYYVSVTRGSATSRSEVYPVMPQKRLPLIGFPLRTTDTDIVLDLQAVFEQVYENGDYGLTLDYTKPPIPPLVPADGDWAKDWLSTRL